MKLHLYEIKCIDSYGMGSHYLYVSAYKVLRKPEDVKRHGFIPDKLRLIIENENWTPQAIKPLALLTYIYYKYFKKHF